MSYSLESNAILFLRKSQDCWAKTFGSSGEQCVIGLTKGPHDSCPEVKKEGRAKMLIFPIF